MRKKFGAIVCMMLLLTSMAFVAVGAETNNVSFEENNETFGDLPVVDSEVDITYPEAGYIYLANMEPIKLSLIGVFGYAIVVNHDIAVEVEAEGVHHVQFVAKHMLTGWETVRSDYTINDGFFCDLDAIAGRYTITVTAYDDSENEINSDTVKVLFLKYGKDDFGVWLHTKYDGVENEAVKLDLGVTEFTNMLDTGSSKDFEVSLESKDDTTVNLGFARKTIEGKPTVETKFNVETDCDTGKEYEVYSEIKFPFPLLNNDPLENDDPYFAIQTGYISSGSGNGHNKVDTSFYVGRDSLQDPRIFKMHLKPENIDSDSKVTFFNKYTTVDKTGEELFYRTFSIDFEPATELTVTSIPKEMKISYDFGESAGKKTKISFRAEGGLLDNIIQSYTVDPLPQYMNFDLTLISGHEFLYESDESYDVIYAVHSTQLGELVSFEVVDLPETIHAHWGLELEDIGDLVASAYAELDMSDEVEKAALYFFGKEIPFFNLENLPKKIRFEVFADLFNGNGEISVIRLLEDERILDFSVSLGDLVVTNTLELKNNLVTLAWDIDPLSGHGSITASRDPGSSLSFTTEITFKDWTFTKELVLECENMEFSWDIDTEKREGRITFERDISDKSPEVTVSIAHNNWVLSDTVGLENTLIELFWNLPDSVDNHAEVGINTDGGNIFSNTLSFDGDVVDLSLNLAIATTETFGLSWDHDSGKISNFEWTGKIVKLNDLGLSLDYAGNLFTIGGEFNFGESGYVDISFNKEVTITFANVQNNLFKIHGTASFSPNRHLRFSWKWGDNGFFKINTYGQSIGQDFNLEFGFLYSAAMKEYKYGFEVSSPTFVETNLNISWDKSGSVPIFYKVGSLPSNWLSWNKQLLWNYDRWDLPW